MPAASLAMRPSRMHAPVEVDNAWRQRLAQAVGNRHRRAIGIEPRDHRNRSAKVNSHQVVAGFGRGHTVLTVYCYSPRTVVMPVLGQQGTRLRPRGLNTTGVSLGSGIAETTGSRHVSDVKTSSQPAPSGRQAATSSSSGRGPGAAELLRPNGDHIRLFTGAGRCTWEQATRPSSNSRRGSSTNGPVRRATARSGGSRRRRRESRLRPIDLPSIYPNAIAEFHCLLAVVCYIKGRHAAAANHPANQLH